MLGGGFCVQRTGRRSERPEPGGQAGACTGAYRGRQWSGCVNGSDFSLTAMGCLWRVLVLEGSDVIYTEERPHCMPCEQQMRGSCGGRKQGV